ncbi:MAG: hypothetical protein QGF56_06490 [Verrucomicrobiota bacterium]|nr:hypothetical protein [Verrucomicrobiota bacterium]
MSFIGVFSGRNTARIDTSAVCGNAQWVRVGCSLAKPNPEGKTVSSSLALGY